MNMMLDEAFIKATNNAYRRPPDPPVERRARWWGRKQVTRPDSKG